MKFKIILLSVLFFVIGLLPALFADNAGWLAYDKVQRIAHTQKYARIVCTSPALCSIVYALGLGKDVVGLGDLCTTPEGAKKVKRIGKWGNTSLEVLVTLNPDLIITQGLDNSLESFSREKNIKILNLDIQSLDDLYESIIRIATLTGAADRGEKIVAEMKDELKAIRESIAPQGTAKVLLTLARTPGCLSRILVPGSKTFLSELLVIAGGENAFANALGAWPQISRESILKISPEVIIELIPNKATPAEISALRQDWENMPQLRAVRNNRVYYICSEKILIPGVDIADIARELNVILMSDGEKHD